MENCLNVHSYFEKGCRKKCARATIPEGNMGYDQYAVPDNAAVESSIINCCFSLAFANIRLWPLVTVPFVQIF